MKIGRQTLVFFILVSWAAAAIGRLFWLQVVSHDFYQAMAQGQQKFFSSTTGERGSLFFRNRETLATNQAYYSVYASLKQIKDIAKTSNILSQVLELEEKTLTDKLSGDASYILIKNKLTEEQVNSLKRLGLDGIELKQEEYRVYPQKNLASTVVGFVDQNNQGQYGLEGFYQDWLAGQAGLLEGEKGGQGLFISLSPKTSFEKGSDLILTLDYETQFMAEKLLNTVQKELKFEKGTIVVMKPDNGEILALADYPNFNPNEYEKEKSLDVFQAPAAQKIFEPGSVFKPLTMAAAIEEGKITPQTSYVDEGVVKIGQIPIYNYDHRTYGQTTMTQVLEKSINTGAVYAEQQLGGELFLDYLAKFGFFEKTGIDLQGEVYSQNKELKKGYEVNFATASFGQGVEITPLQLVKAFSAIANNGRPVQPRLVSQIIGPDGQTKKAEPPVLERVVSPQTSSQVVSMLTSVVENGFGKKAKIPGYFVAGKTGTAQVSWGALGIQKSGYSDKTIQSFIGFAPAFNPQFLILVKLDNPQTKTAEYSALPVFRDLAEYIIDQQQIPPDYQP